MALGQLGSMHRNYFGIKGSDPRIARNGMQRKNGTPGVPGMGSGIPPLSGNTLNMNASPGIPGISSSINDTFSRLGTNRGVAGLESGFRNYFGQQQSTSQQPFSIGSTPDVKPGIPGAAIGGLAAGGVGSVLDAFGSKHDPNKFIGKFNTAEEQSIAAEAVEGQRKTENVLKGIGSTALTVGSAFGPVGLAIGGGIKLVTSALDKLGVGRNRKAEREAEQRIAELRRQGQLREIACLLYTSPSPRDRQKSRMPSSA